MLYLAPHGSSFLVYIKVPSGTTLVPDVGIPIINFVYIILS